MRRTTTILCAAALFTALTAAAPPATQAEAPYFAYSTSTDGSNPNKFHNPKKGQCWPVGKGNWANNQSGLYAHLYTATKCKVSTFFLTMEDGDYTPFGTAATFNSVKFTEKKDEH
ncbi:hypothetical protein FM076_29750 [Streptomyces albus subsp. chlorinus]|uniref:hypothetical protein n=1 Tax=Streptomyces albus TaxID=1888 RepID=UPI00156F2016|nr:hypothetical protein [Streptomyces albus]NSC25121.1 hypothetical protein [Streptomyces albus subsp. chlorinus]